MIFQQLFDQDTGTYTYLLVDPTSREGVLIDPVRERTDRDRLLLEELGVSLRYLLETHVHADHVTGALRLRELTGAQIAISAGSGARGAEVSLVDGQRLRFGSLELVALATPGHTDGCMSFVAGDRVFTGDALLIRGTGRTDFQHGSSERLYKSITEKLFRLPPETTVYPAHDYKGYTSSSIAMEMKWNPRVGGGRSEAEFVRIMGELNLAPPKRIGEAVPANLELGAPPDVIANPRRG